MLVLAAHLIKKLMNKQSIPWVFNDTCLTENWYSKTEWNIQAIVLCSSSIHPFYIQFCWVLGYWMVPQPQMTQMARTHNRQSRFAISVKKKSRSSHQSVTQMVCLKFECGVFCVVFLLLFFLTHHCCESVSPFGNNTFLYPLKQTKPVL